MKKQTQKIAYVVGGIVAILAIVFAVVYLNAQKADTYHPRPLSVVKAEASSVVRSCFELNDAKNLNIPDTDKGAIFNEAISRITDVPAGTTVDVHFHTYSELMSTGTVVYAGDYGSYNFLAEKRSSGWSVSAFETCSNS